MVIVPVDVLVKFTVSGAAPVVLGVPDDHGDVILLRPDTDVKPGTRVF